MIPLAIRLVLAAAWVLSGSSLARAQNSVDARVALSRKVVSIGQPFHLFISVTHPQGAELRIPAVIDFGPDVELLRANGSDALGAGGQPIKVFDLELIAFAKGVVELRGVPITVTRDGRQNTSSSPGAVISVSSVTGGDKVELRDITPPVSVYRADERVFYAAGALGGILLLVGSAMVVRRRARTSASRKSSALAESQSPTVRALTRLADVERQGLPDAEDRRPAYVELSEILRAYVGGECGFAALDLTTAEIALTLEQRAQVELAADVVPWLKDADLVKFAGFKATPDDARATLYDIRAWIERRAEEVGEDIHA